MIFPIELPEYILIFMFGLAIGSFLNVVIYRVPRGESIVLPGSHCPHCNTPLKFYQNIPLVSYLALRGKCSACKHPISSQYFLVELLMGLLAVAIFFKYGWSWDLLNFEILTALLLALGIIDLQTRRLPNPITLTGAIFAVLITLLFRQNHILDMVLGSLVGMGFLMFNWILGKLLFKREGVGMGDIKFAGMIGLFVGPAHTAGMFIFSIFVGVIIGGFFVLFGRKGMFYRIPFGPYMSIGTLISLFWGTYLWSWYAGFSGLSRL